jgi:hypothetical protein
LKANSNKMKSTTMIRKLFLAVLLLSLFISCSDGDITIQSISFNEIGIESCTQTTETTLLFKINDTESLALQLPEGLLKNSVSEQTIQTSIPNQTTLNYRIFSEGISASYYCSVLPEIGVNVVKDANATAGTVFINTSLSEDGNNFKHEIQLSGVSFIDQDGKRITDVNLNDFGVFTTPK